MKENNFEAFEQSAQTFYLGQNPVPTNIEEKTVPVSAAGRPVMKMLEGIAGAILATRDPDSVRIAFKNVLVSMGIKGEEGEAFIRKQLHLEDDSDVTEIEVIEFVALQVYKYGLSARVRTINKQTVGEPPRVFRGPALFISIYASVGRFITKGGTEVIPVLSPDLVSTASSMHYLQDGRWEIPEWYGKAVTTLHSYGLTFAVGLPRSIDISDSVCLQLDIEDDGKICGTEAICPTPGQVLLSLFVKTSKLSDLFGAYSVQYENLNRCLTAIETVSMAAVHSALKNERQ